MEQYINTNYKKKLIRLYKEYDLYQYIKSQYNSLLRYNLKYEKHTIEEAIELSEIWRLQTAFHLPQSKRIIYNKINNIYHEWAYKNYITTLKETITEYVSSLNVKNTKKKMMIQKLFKFVDSHSNISKLYNEMYKFISSRFGLATLIPFSLQIELVRILKDIKVD